MQYSISPNQLKNKNCLVLVGGSGDTSEGFAPLTAKISEKLSDYSICTFNFSTTSKTESILDVQARELIDVFGQLTVHHNFEQIDIFVTSMGAYAAIKLLSSNKYANIIKHVIFFDPANYYLSAKFANSNDVTWSGSDVYNPSKSVISDELAGVTGNCLISIVHLTLRNYGPKGYIDKNFIDRGTDHEDGYPRLSTDMVKAMFSKVPTKNKGRYIEESTVPHGFLRDGNILLNIEKVSQSIVDILVK